MVSRVWTLVRAQVYKCTLEGRISMLGRRFSGAEKGEVLVSQTLCLVRLDSRDHMSPRMALLLSVLLLLAIHGSSGSRIFDGGEITMVPSNSKYCAAWITNTASNNIQGWKVTPKACQAYIKDYMLEGQYMEDCTVTADAALEFLGTFEPTSGKDAVVFDVGDTLLSMLPYYKNHSFGGELFDLTSFTEWENTAAAPALYPILRLYKTLEARNWVLILSSGRTEDRRDLTVKNLIAAGVTFWNELLLRPSGTSGVAAALYKPPQRASIEKEKGYTIRSCIGDQWSDCVGAAAGTRTFKVPNPMYFIP